MPGTSPWDPAAGRAIRTASFRRTFPKTSVLFLKTATHPESDTKCLAFVTGVGHVLVRRHLSVIIPSNYQ